MGWSDIKRDYNFTTSPIAIAPGGDGIYDISFTFLNSTNVSTISYGGASDYYLSTLQAADLVTLSTAQTNAVTAILAPTDAYSVFFSDVTNVTFTEGANGAIAFGQDNNSDSLFIDPITHLASNDVAATTSEYVGPGGSIAKDGDVWLNSQFSSGWSTVSAGNLQFLIILHELSHAMGLDHVNLTGVENNQQYTVMSNIANPFTTALPAGLQLYDIAALQSIYGVNWGGDNGHGGVHANTVYDIGHGFSSNPFIYTIWDGGGTDIIDASGFDHAVEIDLRQGHFSSIGSNGSGGQVSWDDAKSTDHPDPGNVAIAYHAVIENALGTNGDDVLVGNEWNNVLAGGAGNDTIFGDGTAYNDDPGYHDENSYMDAAGTIYGWGPDNVAPDLNLSGNDILIGGAGDDYFYGGLGNDIIHGGYVAADITGVVSGWDAAGEFTGTNNANGHALDDISYSGDVFADGEDTADYSELPEGTGGVGISVALNDSTDTSPTIVTKGASGEYGTDTMFSVEDIVGTPWDDTFTGASASTQYYYGSQGIDIYDMSLGLIDYSQLDQLETNAHIALSWSGGAYTIDKTDDNGSLGQDLVTDSTFLFSGTSGDDTFTGFSLNTPLGTQYFGLAGNDTYIFDLAELAGTAVVLRELNVIEDSDGHLTDIHVSNATSVSFVTWGATASGISIEYQYVYHDVANSTFPQVDIFFSKEVTGPAVETASIGSTNYEFGSYYSDVFTGESAAHIIYGGPGSNTIDYSAATGGVTANLSTGTVSNNGWGYADTLHDISIIIGSHHNDSMTGDGSTTGQPPILSPCHV